MSIRGRLGNLDVAALGALANAPRHHMAFSPAEQSCLGRLWARGLIKLTPGDGWQITASGVAVLDAGGRIQ